MFLHAALDRFLSQMGNSYSGAKPALPTLNINKVSPVFEYVCSRNATRSACATYVSCPPCRSKQLCLLLKQSQQQRASCCPLAWSEWWLQAKQLNQDTPDELYVGSGHPARNVVPLSARLPGSARKLPATVQQQHQLLNSKLQEGSGSGIDHTGTHRLVANNIVAKPQVPQLNMGRHDGSFGNDQPATARPAGGPGSLPHMPQHRAPNTSRAAFAATSQQYAGTTERPAPAAVETGPITPAQALKRYGEYLTAFEQSEVLQYQQVRQQPQLQYAVLCQGCCPGAPGALATGPRDALLLET